MEQTKKICCVTGHRPKGFPWKYTGDPTNMYDFEFEMRMKWTLEALIQDGYNHFICGGAIGVDTIFATELLNLRDRSYPHITLEIAVPCPGQSKKWTESDKAVYADIIQLADEVNVICDRYHDFCFHKRNEYMVNKSDLVLVFWNGEEKGGTYYTYKYAKRKGKETKVFLLQDIMKEADDCEAENESWQISKYGKPIPPVGTDEWFEFMGVDPNTPLPETPPENSEALKLAMADIARINERREKYYKNKKPIP